VSPVRFRLQPPSSFPLIGRRKTSVSLTQLVLNETVHASRHHRLKSSWPTESFKPNGIRDAFQTCADRHCRLLGTLRPGGGLGPFTHLRASFARQSIVSMGILAAYFGSLSLACWDRDDGQRRSYWHPPAVRPVCSEYRRSAGGVWTPLVLNATYLFHALSISLRRIVRKRTLSSKVE
jgi:hypothetical protein